MPSAGDSLIVVGYLTVALIRTRVMRQRPEFAFGLVLVRRLGFPTVSPFFDACAVPD